MSVMEMTHRGPHFESILEEAIQDLKDLMKIPEGYKVMFLQGGASTQFSMIPMNLLGKNGKCDLINTGQWSKKAMQEASIYKMLIEYIIR